MIYVAVVSSEQIHANNRFSHAKTYFPNINDCTGISSLHVACS